MFVQMSRAISKFQNDSERNRHPNIIVHLVKAGTYEQAGGYKNSRHHPCPQTNIRSIILDQFCCKILNLNENEEIFLSLFHDMFLKLEFENKLHEQIQATAPKIEFPKAHGAEKFSNLRCSKYSFTHITFKLFFRQS